MIKEVLNYIKDPNFKIIYVNNSVNVINYSSIQEVSDSMITLIKEKKIVTIRGKDLKIIQLLDQEVLITGVIAKIEL